jgi:CheY-like chemotaxis protein
LNSDIHHVVVGTRGVNDVDALISRLEETGFSVQRASSLAAVAQSVGTQSRVKAVILPDTSDEIDALDVLSRLGREHSTLVTIGLIASLDQLDRHQAGEVDRLLTHDVTPERLGAVLREELTAAHLETVSPTSGWLSATVARFNSVMDESGDADMETVCDALCPVEDCLAAWASRYDADSNKLVLEAALGLGFEPDDIPMSVEAPGEMTAQTRTIGPETVSRYHIQIPIAVDETLLGAVSLLTTRELTGAEITAFQVLCRPVFHAQYGSDTTPRSGPETATTRYARALSHEIKNHLQVAWSAISGLDTESAEYETLAEALDGIEHATTEAAVVADPSIDPPELEPTALKEVAVRTWDRLQVTDDDLTVTVSESTRIIADPQLLELVFTNLFRNSVEHGESPVRVDRLETEDTSGFAVVDSGSGIAPADRERVFEWGYAIGDSTGFGLAIIDQIAASHGWDVAVTEAANGGARFEITGVTFQ